VTTPSTTDDLWRELAPQVLGALIRRYGDFDTAEDAVQEALLAAATQWPRDGVPDDPKAWLIRVASRRWIDQRRSDQARDRREASAVAMERRDAETASVADTSNPTGATDEDDTLTLLLLCCHPALTPPSQVALTLRAVGGLTTAQIARAFLVPESTMAQRISRAKQRIKESGARFRPPPPAERASRMRAVLHVLYLIFNEGYTASGGSDLHRVELTQEAIRLTRMARTLRPDDGEVAGLLALMLLTDARRPARTRPDGGLVPLAEQDRTRWNRAAADEGVRLITATLPDGPVGPFQVQAAIAAVHAEAASTETTDWPQIVTLYRMLEQLTPNPMVSLNRAVAVAMVDGPAEGLAILRSLEGDRRLAEHHRLHAVRGHLLEMAGDADGAVESYVLAARLTTSLPEQRYLEAKAAGLRGETPDAQS
jgi:RNA polymerase sigma factor (sigma-70 family)